MNDINQITDINGTTHDIQDYRISSIVDAVYPVGSIYMSANSTSPATLFGGTWEALQNQFLVGAGDLYTAGVTGGEAEHTLIEAELPVVTEHMTFRNLNYSGTTVGIMAQTDTDGTVNSNYNLTFNAASLSGLTSSSTATQYTYSFGGGEAHNNLPPYLPVYMWQRTA